VGHLFLGGLALTNRLARNLVMVHARAVDLYRRQFQKMQSGVIGITLVSRAMSTVLIQEYRMGRGS
jgi:hypothetical protein